MSISEIARLVKEVVEKEYPKREQIKILKTSSNDNRSYHINSEKIKNVAKHISTKANLLS